MKVVLKSPAMTSAFGGSAISEASLSRALSHHCDLTILIPEGAVEKSFTDRYGISQWIRTYDPLEVPVAAQSGHWLHSLISDADIFHLNGHWKWENAFFARLCEKLRTPYVLHPRGMCWVGHRKQTLKKVFNFLLGQRIVSHAAEIIALSHFEISQLAPYGIAPEKITVIPNGIDYPWAREKSASPHKAPYFLYLGRIESRKNLVFLVEAFSHYLKANGKCDLVLLGPVERHYDAEVLAAAKRNGYQDKVHLLPPVYGDLKWDWMGNATAVVYPSKNEPYGRVPFEAIASGTVPIVPRESGSVEYLEPFLPKSIYTDDSEESLSATLMAAEHLLKPSPKLAEALAWVKTELDWNTIVKHVLKIYEGVGQSAERVVFEKQLSQ